MERDDRLPLRQIVSYADDVARLVAGRSESDLQTDDMLRYALLYLVQIVGEAANRVPDGVRVVQEEIPWRQVIATRHRLVHGYDDIDVRMLWRTVTVDLPTLRAQVVDLLPSGGRRRLKERRLRGDFEGPGHQFADVVRVAGVLD